MLGKVSFEGLLLLQEFLLTLVQLGGKAAGGACSVLKGSKFVSNALQLFPLLVQRFL